MKKSLFLAVCLVMLGISASAVTVNKVLLQHKGNVTLFDGDDMQSAIDAAADGDIIYMTLGAFNKPFTINKEISIRGVGEKTVVNGDVTVDIPNSPKLENTLMEGVRVIGTLDVKSAVDNLVISKCMIDYVKFSADVSGVIIDRCYVTASLALSTYIKDITVNNSKIYMLTAQEGTTKNTTFVNCNIADFLPQFFTGTFINSILERYSSVSNQTLYSSILMNSFIDTRYISISTTSVAIDCYSFNSYSVNRIIDTNCIPIWADEQLKTQGYLGTDGTVVGINGGDTPFTLVSSVPTVTSSELNLDLEERKLNVKLTVSPK